MISRIEFLYKHYNIEKRVKDKVKLNDIYTINILEVPDLLLLQHLQGILLLL